MVDQDGHPSNQIKRILQSVAKEQHLSTRVLKQNFSLYVWKPVPMALNIKRYP